MRKIVIVAICGLLAGTAYAKVKPVAHYNFGKSGNVSFAVAPESVNSSKGDNPLGALGRPLFYADAPSDKAAKGQGCILFNGETDGYRINKSLGVATDNMVLEVWAKARKADQHKAVVVANGTEKSGYAIGQRNKQWVLVVNGAVMAVIGDIVKGRWTHLAVVLDQDKGSVWMARK